MLQIPQPIYDQIRQHGEAAYPNECCGILLGAALPGTVSGAVKLIVQAIPTPNASPTPARHYEIGPQALILAIQQARQGELEILGFYHSHPDHPAEPSATDLTEAHWLGCSYLITSVRNGHASETRSFHLEGVREEDKQFATEELLVVEDD